MLYNCLLERVCIGLNTGRKTGRTPMKYLCNIILVLKVPVSMISICPKAKVRLKARKQSDFHRNKALKSNYIGGQPAIEVFLRLHVNRAGETLFTTSLHRIHGMNSTFWTKLHRVFHQDISLNGTGKMQLLPYRLLGTRTTFWAHSLIGFIPRHCSMISEHFDLSLYFREKHMQKVADAGDSFGGGK